MVIKHSYCYTDLSLKVCLPVVCTAIALKWLYEANLWQGLHFMVRGGLLVRGNLCLGACFGYYIRVWGWG